MPTTKLICKRCGGSRILRDAYAQWDGEAREWVLGPLFDSVICDDCGDEADTDEVEDVAAVA